MSNSFRYVGKYGVQTDADDLLYMRARYYKPSVGRFINKDPIGLRGGINLYSYVFNNLLKYVDPSGLFLIGGPDQLIGGGLIGIGIILIETPAGPILIAVGAGIWIFSPITNWIQPALEDAARDAVECQKERLEGIEDFQNQMEGR
ncbi:MAG: RHS repeat-associated core domain-containing protein [Candidatus Omnitrophica bacterium]|nr:RHS repeat-associated core domain-containing protein [Candidatus Omnitrophota bacterium]